MWYWFKENSQALQGFAALVVTLFTIFGGFQLWRNANTAQLSVSISSYESSMPNGFLRATAAAWELALSIPDDGSQPIRTRLLLDRIDREIGAKSTAYLGDDIDLIRIDIHNQTDDEVSGINLRTNYLTQLWAINISGTFLRQEEKDTFAANLQRDGDSPYVLPVLPALPGNSTLSIAIYGNSVFPQFRDPIILSGATYELETFITVPDSFWNNPDRRESLLFFLPMIAGLLYLVFLGILSVSQTKAKQNVLYNRACELAKRGDRDAAISTLEAAIEAGYQNFQHARADKDFSSISDSKVFQKLVNPDVPSE